MDNALLVAVAEATKGERLVLGICEDKNYRTIVATAMANGHLVTARTPMDVNLAKQLNILISDMGLPLDRILMDPTTGALGYGIEYGYLGDGAPAPGGAAGRQHDPVADAGHAWVRSLEDQRIQGRRRRAGRLGRLARARDQLGDHDRHHAARIGRGYHRAAPSGERPAGPGGHRRVDGGAPTCVKLITAECAELAESYY